MQGDADGDNDADGGDFLIWQRQLGGASASSSITAAVPEPDAMALISVGGCCLVFSCARRRSAFEANPRE